tara:strand:+ start:160 stop:429 length:270 start_codon:yes stop_codon:yes gene_type:complete
MKKLTTTSEIVKLGIQTKVRFNPNGKTPISSPQWVSLYCDLACHIESKLYPNRKTHNEYGDRLEETEDDFLEIVDDVEEIMSHYFTKTS